MKLFKKDTVTVAKGLLGAYLKHSIEGENLIGRIVETEAYLFDDEASHSYCGKTKRNEAMFKDGGHIYIYQIYGKYLCLNFVTATKETGEAVLIRAIEPIKGIETMKKRRGREDNLCNGPAKLMIAMGITKEYNCKKINETNLKIIFRKKKYAAEDIVSTKRIGITKGKDKNLRFYIKGNKFVSKR